jgi:molybdate transport system substrate-binding protein
VKSILLLFLFSAGLAGAQTPSPAQPADPSQAIPAQPALPAPAGADSPGDAGPTVTVLADSSLKSVLQALAQAWADAQPDGPQMPLTLTNAATMRSRVTANPTWDVVIDADLADVKALTDQGLLAPEGRHELARNSLVILGRAPLVKAEAPDWYDLVGDEWKKIALGDPNLTASGRAAQHALQKHDLLGDDHKNLYVYAGTEALALQLAERDQVDAVFLYRSDLGGVTLPGFDIMPLSGDDAPPIFYTAAVGRLAKNPAAAHSFIEYCASDAARDIWTRFGFEMN